MNRSKQFIRFKSLLIVRLVGDKHVEYRGRVEVLYNGVWGRICDHGWNLHEANLVCRQLGYNDAVLAAYNEVFDKKAGVIGVTNVQCSGSEASITECAIRGKWGVVSSCSGGYDVGVMCTPPGEKVKTVIKRRTVSRSQE